jgi:2-hydroxy-3-keto-5-methylthiopentenyl-1-phosphate phosphatase
MTVKPTLIQCDFDGTITVGDVSFQILDEFTGQGWRQLFDDYMQGKMSVNAFNSAAFARVKASREVLDDFVRRHTVMRAGFQYLIDVCRQKDYRFYIVSNGMMFYIDTVLKMLGLTDIEHTAAQAIFRPDGVEAWYAGPGGERLENGFKESYTREFLRQGYRVIYIGNGASDFPPARMCQHIYAIDNLLAECRKAGVAHTPFTDLYQVADGLRSLPA